MLDAHNRQFDSSGGDRRVCAEEDGGRARKNRQKDPFDTVLINKEFVNFARIDREKMVHRFSNDFTYTEVVALTNFPILLDNNCRVGELC